MKLTVSDLTVMRQHMPVIAGLSFEVAPGEALFLRGRNGVGKSTLLRALCGILPIHSGKVQLDQIDLSENADMIHQHLHYAGHLDAIKPQLSVAENLQFWAQLYAGDAQSALNRFHLDEIADRPAHACSAGQKRRLGLARLLVAHRPVWILDEPTVSLDTDTTDLIRTVIEDHCAAGGIAVIATHIPLHLSHEQTLHLEPFHGNAPPQTDPFLSGDWT